MLVWGRTGTFITIDHVLEQVAKEEKVDVPGTITKIRHQRMKLVQTVVGCICMPIALYRLQLVMFMPNRISTSSFMMLYWSQ